MGRRRAAARERRLASRHAPGTRRPWRCAGAEAWTRSMIGLAFTLAMAEVAAAKAPNVATTVSDKMVHRQTSEAEAVGPPLEGEGEPSLLLRRRRRHLLLQPLAMPSTSSNLLPHPLHRSQLLRRSRRRPHHLRLEVGRQLHRRKWQLVRGGRRISSMSSGCSGRTPGLRDASITGRRGGCHQISIWLGEACRRGAGPRGWGGGVVGGGGA
jgi:hypothetical protein